MTSLEFIATDRPGQDDDSSARMAAQLVGSYLGIRLVIGIVGLLLPWALIVIDWQFMTEGRQIRGSMSAYYHSPARDLFVGGLVAIGGFLLLYMTGRWRTWEFSLSSVAGLAVWTVAFFPTGRAGSEGTERSCTDFPGPPPCTAIQHKYGEGDVALVHAVGAGVFVVLLAGLCLVFALREFGHGRGARRLMGEERDAAAVWGRLRSEPVGWTRFLLREAPRVPFYLGCGVLILLGGWWATWGGIPLPFRGYSLQRVYVGEVVAFTAFGISWLAASWDLVGQLGRRATLNGPAATANAPVDVTTPPA
jgi:hypothetical protein